MPWSLARLQQSGDLHFITFSCRHRAPLLRRAADRDLFEDALEAMRIRRDTEIHGYVVMPEHVHLLLSEPEGKPLSLAIQGLKQSVSHRLKHGEEPFWETRYYDFNVWSEKKRVEKLKYMHRNPVVRGLAKHPFDWQWSSFRQYARASWERSR